MCDCVVCDCVVCDGQGQQDPGVGAVLPGLRPPGGGSGVPGGGSGGGAAAQPPPVGLILSPCGSWLFCVSAALAALLKYAAGARPV